MPLWLAAVTGTWESRVMSHMNEPSQPDGTDQSPIVRIVSALCSRLPDGIGIARLELQLRPFSTPPSTPSCPELLLTLKSDESWDFHPNTIFVESPNYVGKVELCTEREFLRNLVDGFSKASDDT